MVANAQKKWAVEEYLAFERNSEEKHEYFDGQVFPLGQPPKTPTHGVGRRHSLIMTNTICSLGNQLANEPCEVYPNDMRVKLGGTKFVYPDVTVVRDRPQFEDSMMDILLNPTIIVEVLSPSTEGNDRGKKFVGYRMLESVQEYLLIEQAEARIEHYVRTSQGEWLYSQAVTLDTTVKLPSINCSLLLSDIYRKITFETDDTPKED